MRATYVEILDAWGKVVGQKLKRKIDIGGRVVELDEDEEDGGKKDAKKAASEQDPPPSDVLTASDRRPPPPPKADELMRLSPRTLTLQGLHFSALRAVQPEFFHKTRGADRSHLFSFRTNPFLCWEGHPPHHGLMRRAQRCLAVLRQAAKAHELLLKPDMMTVEDIDLDLFVLPTRPAADAGRTNDLKFLQNLMKIYRDYPALQTLGLSEEKDRHLFPEGHVFGGKKNRSSLSGGAPSGNSPRGAGYVQGFKQALRGKNPDGNTSGIMSLRHARSSLIGVDGGLVSVDTGALLRRASTTNFLANSTSPAGLSDDLVFAQAVEDRPREDLDAMLKTPGVSSLVFGQHLARGTGILAKTREQLEYVRTVTG